MLIFSGLTPIDDLLANSTSYNVAVFAGVVIAHAGMKKLGLVDRAVVDGVKTAIATIEEKPADWTLTRWLRSSVEKRAQRIRTVHLL